MEAVNEGRRITENFYLKIRPYGVTRGDFAVFGVFATSKNLGKVARVITFEPQDAYADSHDLEATKTCLGLVPIGYVVCVLNRQEKEFIAHARPLLLQDKPLRLLESLVGEAANLKDWAVN